MSAFIDRIQTWPVGGTSDESHGSGRGAIRMFSAVAVSFSVFAAFIIVSEQYAWGTVIGIALAFAMLSIVKPQLALVVFLIAKPIESTLNRFGIELYGINTVNPDSFLYLFLKAVNPDTFLTLLYASVGLSGILVNAHLPKVSLRRILPMLLLPGWIILSVAWNPHVGTERLADLAEIKRATFFFIGFILVMVTPNKRRYLSLYLAVFFLVCAYLSIDLAWLRMDKAMFAKVESRVITFKESIIHTSPLVLGLGGSMLVALAVEANISLVQRLLRLCGAGLLVLSSFLLLSRALGAAVIIGVLATLLSSGVRKGKLWMLLLVVLSLWLLLPQDLTARLEHTLLSVQSGVGSYTTRRLEVAWPDAISTISEHPVLGVGYGVYKQMAKLAPHNQLLGIWVEIGIVGVILFLWMFASLLNVTWRARRDGDSRTRAMANGLFGQLLGCAAALQFSDSFFYPWLTYALFFAAVLLEPVERKTAEQRFERRLEERSPASVTGCSDL